jgi:choline dehydrogenase-like flavoprotein
VRIRDLRNASDAIDETDLCVVGSGPAGLAIAQHFAGGTRRVLIVESGDREERPEIRALDEVESVGAPRQSDQALVRTRILGGTSHVWTGRCAELDASDYEARPWVPLSGWPLTRGELAPFLLVAAERLGLTPLHYDAALSARLGAMPRQWAPLADQVEPCAWQFSQDPRDHTQPFRSAHGLERLPSDNIDLLLNATVTQLNLDPDGRRLESIEVASLTGRRQTLRARAFVLCAGAIETPRLLLASRGVVPEGVGNRHDLVGRYLMDHPRCRLGHFEPNTAGPMLLRFGQQRLVGSSGPRQFLPGLRISPVLQRDEELLNCAAWVRQDHAEDDPWDALRRLRQSGHGLLSRRRDLEAVVFQPRLLVRQLRRRVLSAQPVVHKVAHLDLMCDVEQMPDPASRLTLSDRRDALGVPLARIDWRIGDCERRTIRRFGQVAAESFARMGFRAPLLSEAVRSGDFDASDLIDVAHPSGTTRMASDPTRGVVDEHCQVHGIERLYIAGGAVFPTNGHVNPTLTIVALALRLAAWLEASAAWV